MAEHLRSLPTDGQGKASSYSRALCRVSHPDLFSGQSGQLQRIDPVKMLRLHPRYE